MTKSVVEDEDRSVADESDGGEDEPVENLNHEHYVDLADYNGLQITYAVADCLIISKGGIRKRHQSSAMKGYRCYSKLICEI